MQEILRILDADRIVLDPGSGPIGSFPADYTKAIVIRVDAELHNPGLRNFSAADAASLPLPASFFDAVIANHTLQHSANLEEAPAELKRVLKPGGMLFVAAPDASKLTDKVYRPLSRGGGHLNAITDARQFGQLGELKTGRPHVATRLLFSSFSFLNRWNSPVPRPKRLWLIGGGYEWTLKLAQIILHAMDRAFGTRLRVYGWAFSFGPVIDVDRRSLPNICVRLGSAHAASYLQQLGMAQPGLIGSFQCPQCEAKNLGLWATAIEAE